MNAPMKTKFTFTKATKEKAKLRLALSGPAGSGKTYSALEIARALVGPSGKIALVDTEHESASKYADIHEFERITITENYHPDQVRQAIQAAKDQGFDILIFDTFTFFWNGPGGFLELVDEEVKRQKSKNQKPDSHSAWKAVDPVYKNMIQAILTAPIHIIVTLRAKTETERQEVNGKTRIVKLGMAPEMRDNFQYEMDIEGMLDMDNCLVVGKTRCPAVKGKVYERPGENFVKPIKEWLEAGVEGIDRWTAPPSAPAEAPPVAAMKRAEVGRVAAPAADVQALALVKRAVVEELKAKGFATKEQQLAEVRRLNCGVLPEESLTEWNGILDDIRGAANPSPASTSMVGTETQTSSTASTSEARESDETRSTPPPASHPPDTTMPTEHGSGSPRKTPSATTPATGDRDAALRTLDAIA